MPSSEEILAFWNAWDEAYLEIRPLDSMSVLRGERALNHVKKLHLDNPAILEIGCGSGWLSSQLNSYGRVTGVDIADKVVCRAGQRYPDVRFLAGDFVVMDLPPASFDIIVVLEVIGNVPDQPAFFARMALALKPGGYLIASCQNKMVYQRREDIVPLAIGQIRKWLGTRDVRALLRPNFRVVELVTIAPAGHLGVLRFVNSYRLESLAKRICCFALLTSLKEGLGFGQSIVLLAQHK